MTNCADWLGDIIAADTSAEIIHTWQWQITNFGSIHAGIGNYISSKAVSAAGKSLWTVHLYANGYDFTTRQFIDISVQLDRMWLQIIKDLPCLFIVYLINENKKELEIFRTNEITSTIYIKKCIRRNYLFCEDNGLLPSGNLSLRFKACLKFNDEAYIFGGLENILNNKKFSDLKIVVGKKEFYAYKRILALQSPVFAAMFEHDMKEKQKNTVHITGIDPEVIEEMLWFIYTGKLNNIKSIACDLYAVADEYKIDQLKILCEESLINNLKVETVTSLIIYAERYRAKTLKEKALEFFKLNAKPVILSEEYKSDLNNLLPLLPELIEKLVL